MTEVKFNVVVNEAGGLYGITLYIYGDGMDEDSVPCYKTVFRGKVGGNPDNVCEIYAECHQEAMDRVGIEKQMTAETWVQKLGESVILASELMAAYGFHRMAYDSIPGDVTDMLFSMDSVSDDIDPIDLKSMN